MITSDCLKQRQKEAVATDNKVIEACLLMKQKEYEHNNI